MLQIVSFFSFPTGLIVSAQALEGNPFRNSEALALMAEAAMLGGARAMSGLLAIANASEEDYQKLTAAVDGSSDAFAKLADGSIVPLNEALASGQEIIEQYDGAAQAMAATMGDNLNGDIVKLKSAASELAISVGQLLIPLAKDIVDKIQQVVNFLNSLDEDTKKVITTVLGVVAAVGPILLIIGKLITGIGSVISAVGTIQGALAALAPIITGIGTAISAAIPAIISSSVCGRSSRMKLFMPALSNWNTPSVFPAPIISSTLMSL